MTTLALALVLCSQQDLEPAFSQDIKMLTALAFSEKDLARLKVPGFQHGLQMIELVYR